MKQDLGHGLTTQEREAMLDAFAHTLGQRLQYSFWTIRWHRLRERPLAPFPEFFRIRDEAERRMWNILRRTHFRLIQGGKKG